MGEVYRARDTVLKREVAVKILPDSYSSDSGRLRRFQQEAEATAALNHPNTLTVHQVGQQDGISYIVTELLQGDTLRQKLRGGPLPVRTAIDYAVQIARGLANRAEPFERGLPCRPDQQWPSAHLAVGDDPISKPQLRASSTHTRGVERALLGRAFLSSADDRVQTKARSALVCR